MSSCSYRCEAPVELTPLWGTALDTAGIPCRPVSKQCLMAVPCDTQASCKMMSIHSPRLGGLGVRTGGCCLPCPPPSPCRPLGIQSSSVHRTCRRPATRPAALGGATNLRMRMRGDLRSNDRWSCDLPFHDDLQSSRSLAVGPDDEGKAITRDNEPDEYVGVTGSLLCSQTTNVVACAEELC